MEIEELKKKIEKIVEREVIHSMKDGRKLEIIKNLEKFTKIKLGDIVSLVSIHKNDPKGTMIGIYVGGIILDEFSMFSNPVFYVPKMKRTLAGIEPWWDFIPKEDWNLSCDEMASKNKISWDDINDFIEGIIFLCEDYKKGDKNALLDQK